MRTDRLTTIAWIALLAVVAGCNGTEQRGNGASASEKKPAASPTNPTAQSQPEFGTGKVLETMDAGGYTYVKIDANGKQEWYAAPQFQVSAGETVAVPSSPMPMRDFESPTLGRTFDVVYFVSGIRKAGAIPAPAVVRDAHPTAPAPAADVDLAGIEKAEGGMSVAEVFAAGSGAAGREVVLRGKVVKYNAGIMGKNWLHLRDGTGGEGTNDITVTTRHSAKVGDTVLVKGRLAADRDFGFGYKYALIIEEATVAVE